MKEEDPESEYMCASETYKAFKTFGLFFWNFVYIAEKLAKLEFISPENQFCRPEKGPKLLKIWNLRSAIVSNETHILLRCRRKRTMFDLKTDRNF